MTIKEFAERNKIKKKETVIKWITDGLIPGANLCEDFVPNSARIPYTKARAKNSKAIYVSIVKATEKRYHVTADIYNLSEDEFNGYINRLIEAGLIAERVTDGIRYYDLPLPDKSYTKKFIIDTIEALARGVSYGKTMAIANA